MALTGTTSNFISNISYSTVLSFDGDTFDANQVGYGTVIYVNGTYSLYYAGVAFSNAKELGLATSGDGSNFLRFSNDPIISSTQEPWFASFRILPSTVLHENDTYKMWFFGINSNSISDSNQTTGWGYATSTDGIDWSFGVNPIRNETGSYQGDQLIEVVKLGDNYLSYYLDLNGPNYGVDTKYYVAFSTDGINFTGDVEFTTASGPLMVAATTHGSAIISIWSEAGGYYTAYSFNGVDFFRVASIALPTNVSPTDLTVVGNSVIVWTDKFEGLASSGINTNSIGQFELALDSFLLAAPPNSPPFLAHALVDQSVDEDQSFSFVLPADAFTDVDSDELTLSAKLTDGSVLPSWLTFDAPSRSFVGTPPPNFNGVLQIEVTATDGLLSSSDVFALSLMPVNDTPVLANALVDQAVAGDQAVSFELPANAFTDVDSDELTLSAQLVDGLSLPNWLVFDASTRSFFGTPPANFSGVLQIEVTASDGSLSVSDVFSLAVTPVEPDPYEGWTIGTTDRDFLFSPLFENNRVFGDAGNDVITGGFLSDNLDGGAGNDTIFGLSGNDIISGGEGADLLFGDFGKDRITGGIGKDILSGGYGNDVFAFLSMNDFGHNALSRDVIADFEKGSDKIDMSSIDAQTAFGGDQAFAFLSTKGTAFTGVAGQLRWFYENNSGNSNDNTIVAGDVNGDGVADFQIELDGFVSLTANDFLL